MATSLKGLAKDEAERSLASVLLLACGVVGPLLFIVVFLLEGLLRPDYNPLRHPVSSLSLGASGWIQAINFLMVGSALIACMFGLRGVLRRGSRGALWGPLLIGIAGVGLFGAGIFTTDPLFGYPPDAPLRLAQYTLHGHFHDLFSMFFFIGSPSSCFVFCRRFALEGKRAWAIYSFLAGFGMLAAFVLASIGFKQTPGFVELAGVFQRLSIAFGLTFVSVLALKLIREKADV